MQPRGPLRTGFGTVLRAYRRNPSEQKGFHPILRTNPLQTIKSPIKHKAELEKVDYTHVNTHGKVCTHTQKTKCAHVFHLQLRIIF